MAVLLAGCGGGGSSTTASVERQASPHQEVVAVADAFSGAFGAGEIKAACRYWGANQDRDFPGSCVRVYTGGDATWRQKFLTAKVDRAVVTGSKATVAYSNDTIAKLHKKDGEWLMYELGDAKYYAGYEEEQAEREFEREWQAIERESE